MSDLTISQAISAYLDSVQLARSQNTARTYKNALNVFQRVLKEFWLDPEKSPAEKINGGCYHLAGNLSEKFLSAHRAPVSYCGSGFLRIRGC